MIDSLSLAITLGCLLTAAGAVAVTASGGFRAERVAVPLLGLELALLLQAVLAGVGLLRGHRPSEPATHLAYLAFSVVVLPVTASQVRGTTGRWAGTLVTAALLVQAVLVVRLQTTWRSA